MAIYSGSKSSNMCSGRSTSLSDAAIPAAELQARLEISRSPPGKWEHSFSQQFPNFSPNSLNSSSNHVTKQPGGYLC